MIRLCELAHSVIDGGLEAAMVIAAEASRAAAKDGAAIVEQRLAIRPSLGPIDTEDADRIRDYAVQAWHLARKVPADQSPRKPERSRRPRRPLGFL